MGEIKGKNILDLGCGSGIFSELLAKRGALVTGIDVSENWIAFCKSEYKNSYNISFFVSDASSLTDVADQTFDFVVMNMVLLNIESKETIRVSFKEIYRVLKPAGSLIFTDIHPICLMSNDTIGEKQIYNKDFSYFKDRSAFKSEVLLSDCSKIVFNDVHWTLETISDYLTEAGLHISKIVEPQPIKDSPDILKVYNLPEHMIFVCKKHRVFL